MQTPTLEFDKDRVKWIRVQLGETQEQFAGRIGVRADMVSRWESGTAVPTRGPVLKALLDAEGEIAA